MFSPTFRINIETNELYYWILYAYQFVGIVFLTFTLISLENYHIFCMVCAAAQIEIIGMRLKELGRREMDTKIECKRQQSMIDLERLVQCVKDHKFSMKSFVILVIR